MYFCISLLHIIDMSSFKKFADTAKAAIVRAADPIIDKLEDEFIHYVQRQLNRLPNILSIGTVNGELIVHDVDGKLIYSDKYSKLVEEIDTALTEYNAATGYVPQAMKVFRDKVQYKHPQD